MAVVMGATYPDLFAAVGVHSGLAYRAANDVVTAFAAMRGDVIATRAILRSSAMSEAFPLLRTIVFHGSADKTVHPKNAYPIISETAARADVRADLDEQGWAGGRAYLRKAFVGLDGHAAVEYWLVQDAGHSWCGGDPNGSFTERLGPNASAEMVRFFLASALT